MREQVIDSLVQMNNLKDSMLREWEDHALRMKRICGVPDTVSWSYKQKVVHNINTKDIFKK